MTQEGLKEVENPSSLLLEERPENAPGSIVFACMEGLRPLMVEIQALVSLSCFGTPRRMAAGFDTGRLALLSAVLEKRVGVPLSSQDIYINVIGGLKVDEPAADLAVAISLVSSYYGISLNSKIVVMGEIGLTGEIRSIPQIEQRIREASRLGYSTFVVPRGNQKDLAGVKGKYKIQLASHIQEVIEFLNLMKKSNSK